MEYQQKKEKKRILDETSVAFSSYEEIFERPFVFTEGRDVKIIPPDDIITIAIPFSGGMSIKNNSGIELKEQSGKISILERYQYIDGKYQKIYYSYSYHTNLYCITCKNDVTTVVYKPRPFSFRYDMDPQLIRSDHPLNHLSVIFDCPRLATKKKTLERFLYEVKVFLTCPDSEALKEDPLFYEFS